MDNFWNHPFMMVSQNIAETVKGKDMEFHVHFPTMIDNLPLTFISICYSKQKLIKDLVFKKIFVKIFQHC